MKNFVVFFGGKNDEKVHHVLFRFFAPPLFMPTKALSNLFGENASLHHHKQRNRERRDDDDDDDTERKSNLSKKNNNNADDATSPRDVRESEESESRAGVDFFSLLFFVEFWCTDEIVGC